MNAVRTHIEHFIGSNPLLASTSCTDPVNNLLKSPSKRRTVDIPRIVVVNLTRADHADGGRDNKTVVRSRSCSPFWVAGQTSTYSEVVKTGCSTVLPRDNSCCGSAGRCQQRPAERESRRSGFGLLAPPSSRTRSPSPKEKNAAAVRRRDEKPSPTVEAAAKPIKRRSRSRRNRSRKKNGNHEVTVQKPPEIIVVSDVKNRILADDEPRRREVNDGSDEPPPPPQRTDRDDDVRAMVGSDSPSCTWSRLPSADYSDTCFVDLNERLMGIFGSVDKKHYNNRHNRVFDRPRSKSDTRDLNTLARIFTTTTTTNTTGITTCNTASATDNCSDDYNYYCYRDDTCRFERSGAESVKYNYSDRDITSGSRRSLDHNNVILSSPSPFAPLHDAPPPPPSSQPPPMQPTTELRRWSDDGRQSAVVRRDSATA